MALEAIMLLCLVKVLWDDHSLEESSSAMNHETISFSVPGDDVSKSFFIGIFQHAKELTWER